MEMGGKNPMVIMEDADLDIAIPVTINGAFYQTGQRCTASSRVIVHEKIYDAFVERFVSEMDKLSVGPALDPTTQIGPVVSDTQLKSNLSYVEIARNEGCEVVSGQHLAERNTGYFQRPGAFLNANNKMRSSREEIFGPVLPVKEYDDFNETVSYVNSKERPLGLYLFSKDKDKEKKVLENTTSGGVTLNDVIWHIGQEELPFGGVGPSGTGSYHGHDGFKEFSHAKAVYKQFSADLMAQMMPPYKGKMFESMKNQILKK